MRRLTETLHNVAGARLEHSRIREEIDQEQENYLTEQRANALERGERIACELEALAWIAEIVLNPSPGEDKLKRIKGGSDKARLGKVVRKLSSLDNEFYDCDLPFPKRTAILLEEIFFDKGIRHPSPSFIFRRLKFNSSQRPELVKANYLEQAGAGAVSFVYQKADPKTKRNIINWLGKIEDDANFSLPPEDSPLTLAHALGPATALVLRIGLNRPLFVTNALSAMERQTGELFSWARKRIKTGPLSLFAGEIPSLREISDLSKAEILPGLFSYVNQYYANVKSMSTKEAQSAQDDNTGDNKKRESVDFEREKELLETAVLLILGCALKDQEPAIAAALIKNLLKQTGARGNYTNLKTRAEVEAEVENDEKSQLSQAIAPVTHNKELEDPLGIQETTFAVFEKVFKQNPDKTASRRLLDAGRDTLAQFEKQPGLILPSELLLKTLKFLTEDLTGESEERKHAENLALGFALNSLFNLCSPLAGQIETNFSVLTALFYPLREYQAVLPLERRGPYIEKLLTDFVPFVEETANTQGGEIIKGEISRLNQGQVEMIFLASFYLLSLRHSDRCSSWLKQMQENKMPQAILRHQSEAPLYPEIVEKLVNTLKRLPLTEMQAERLNQLLHAKRISAYAAQSHAEAKAITLAIEDKLREMLTEKNDALARRIQAEAAKLDRFLHLLEKAEKILEANPHDQEIKEAMLCLIKTINEQTANIENSQEENT